MGGYWGVRVLSWVCVVYKQTRRKQSSEECEGGVVKESKSGEGDIGAWGVGGTRGQGPLSLSLSSSPKKRKEKEKREANK